MSVSFSARKSLCVWGFLVVFPTLLWGQTYLLPRGGEFRLGSPLPGDQVNPSVALGSTNGVVAWEDNWIDKQGSGIGSAALDTGLTGAGAPKRVNWVAANDQIKPQVQLLCGGQTLYVWESKVGGDSDIYARFVKNGKFYPADHEIRLNTFIRDQQISPAVAALPDGSAIVCWASFGQGKRFWGVYARRLLANGTAPKPEFLVTKIRGNCNQREPAIAAQANGNFVVTWASEDLSPNGIDILVNIHARIFAPTGVAFPNPNADEIRINTRTNLCASPAVAGTADGGFTILWAEKDELSKSNNWDIVGRAFSIYGAPKGDDFFVNGYRYGDQYRPKIAAGPTGCLAVWTSYGQDGSREGVYGRFLPGGAQVAGDEFRVNTTTISRQIHPAVAWNGVDRFLVVWSSFAGESGFDLFGQTYFLNATP